MKKKNPNLTRLMILLVLAVVLIVYLAVPAANSFVNNAMSILGSANLDAVAEYIRSFGSYAMAFSFVLMVFSSLIAPLPAFMITLSNAAIFGWWQGAILSWSSAMVGAGLCFFLSRGLGRDVVEKIAGKGALAGVEGYFKKYGTKTILICRLLPFVSFDAVSYFAGLTPIKFLPFFIATGIGQTPATIVYSYVGGMLTGGAKFLMVGLLCLFSLMILVGIIRQIYTDRQAKKAEKANG
ncbi:MAG: TVP38/TMEM64 family protein [Oscillospiraceae bacterium]|nr:TVP38/TMEM64 family protein [Oscillospiraceae bacterium]